mgnify:CR=1 FL=1
MMVKDGDGTLIEFEWPSMWYCVKVGFAATVGVAIAVVVLYVPLALLYLAFLTGLIRAIVP